MPEILGSFMGSSDRKREGRCGPERRNSTANRLVFQDPLQVAVLRPEGLPRFGGWNKLPHEAAQSAQMPLGTRSSPADGETSMNATPVVSPLLLRNVPLFSLLSEGQLQLLTRVLSRKSFPKNSAVIAAGDPT